MNSPRVPVAVSPLLVGIVDQMQDLFEKVSRLPDAKQLEQNVHEGLKEIDRSFMETCIQEKAKESVEKDIREVRCLKCDDGWAPLLRSDEPRSIVTVRGKVDYRRAIWRCSKHSCQRQRCLFDEELGLDFKERFTPLMQDKIAWEAATASSFESASKNFAHQMEMAVAPRQIYRIKEKISRRALAMQDKEVKQRGAPASLDHPVPVAEQPETLVVEMDGTCVMGRDGAGHDVKCATVFGLDARATTGSAGKERPLLLRRCYCATSLGIAPFSAMTWALAVWWGVRKAKRIAVVGDGADWIWNLSKDRFHFSLADGTATKPVEILDFYHAAENLGKARDAIYQNPESKVAQEWFKTWRDRVRQGQVEDLIEHLRKRRKAAKDDQSDEKLRTRIAYFERHKSRMQYPEYEAQDLPIGSGAIEGTCKNLIKGRMDGVGMRWDIDKGIEQMVALRVRLFNNKWGDLWDHEQPQLAQTA